MDEAIVKINPPSTAGIKPSISKPETNKLNPQNRAMLIIKPNNPNVTNDKIHLIGQIRILINANNNAIHSAVTHESTCTPGKYEAIKNTMTAFTMIPIAQRKYITAFLYRNSSGAFMPTSIIPMLLIW